MGQHVKGKSEGYGIFEWVNGDKYDGLWKNDKRNGEGLFCDANGEIQKSIWKNDKEVSVISVTQTPKSKQMAREREDEDETFQSNQ